MKFFASTKKLRNGKRLGTFEIEQGESDGRSDRGCHRQKGFQ